MADVAALDFQQCLPRGSGLKTPLNFRVAGAAVTAVYGLPPEARRALARAAAGIGRWSGRIFRHGVDAPSGDPDVIASTRLLGPESPLDGPTIGHVERQAASLWGFNPAHPFWTSRLARRGWNRKTKLASLSSHDLAALELLLYGQTPPKLAVLYDFAARLSLSDLATTLSDWLTQSVAESAGAALLIESGPAPHLSLREAHVEGELFSTIEEVHVFRDGKLALSGSLDSLREQWLVATAYFAEGPPESLGMEWASRLAWFGPERAVLLVERPRRDAVEERLRSLKPLGFGLAELRLADLGYFCGTSSPWRAPGGA